MFGSSFLLKEFVISLLLLRSDNNGTGNHDLELLREKKDQFDLVISNVHMLDMDGFKLLKLVGLEMDLPGINS